MRKLLVLVVVLASTSACVVQIGAQKYDCVYPVNCTGDGCKLSDVPYCVALN